MKKEKFEKLLNAVRQMIIKREVCYGDKVTAEVYAEKLGVKKHYIVQCFAILNKEGLISHAINENPRNSWTREYRWFRTSYGTLFK